MATGDYVTAANFKTYAGITVSTFDTIPIGTAISAASKAIDGYCGRRFYVDGSATARTYRSTNSHRLEVDDFSTAAGLVVKHDSADNGTYDVTWLAADYELDPANLLLDGLPWAYTTIRAVGDELFPYVGRRRYRTQVTATWGWPAVPAEVTDAAYVLTLDLFKSKDAPFGIVGASEFGQFRIRQNPQLQMLLHPYRRQAVKVG